MNDPSRQGVFRHTLSSLQFLSRLPVHRLTFKSQPIDFSRSTYTFPVAGLLITLPSALALYLANLGGLDALVVSLITVAVQIIVTGALHEDGLADVVDGFWGGTTRERKLEIMRDSTIGTYGVLALICSVSLRVLLLAATIRHIGPVGALLLYLAVGSLSRLAILQPWSALPPARTSDTSDPNTGGKQRSGLSARYGTPSWAVFIRACILSAPALFIILFGFGLAPLLLSLLLLEAAILVVSYLALKHVGGHTGDVLGATQQISEIGLLLGVTIAM